MIIQLDHIEKTYGSGSNKVPVLHDVNMRVEEGEYIAIMGPSGSGKSTLMNILGYLDTPTGGTYLFDGEDNARAGDARMARIRNQKIGFVFQSFHLMQRRRAWENVALPLMYGNVRRKERKQRAEEALCQVGLEDRISRAFDASEIIPAAGQGILAVQGREGEACPWLEGYADEAAGICARCERAFVRELDGGCTSPVCAYAELDGETVRVRALYWDPETNEARVGEADGDIGDAEAVGIDLARRLRGEVR